MLNFSTTRSLAGDAIPENLTTLSVSWLNNQFKAMAVVRGNVEGTWERPGEIEGANNFENFLREAVEKTGYRGQTVSILLAHPRLVQQLMEMPPVKGAALKKVVKRQAQQQKMFVGEAAWTSQTSLSGKGTQWGVLHLFPQVMLDQFAQGCQRNGLHLTSVVPVSAVLHHQVTQLPLEEDDIALLAAETGGSTTVVVGRSDGKILLARTLPGTWNEGAERMAVDLNRSILFVNQQYGVAVNNGVWLFGPGAEQQEATIQKFIQIPVNVSPVKYTPFYWATEALKLRPSLNPNFISAELQKAPQRRIFAKVVGTATALVVLAALAVAFYTHLQAQLTLPQIEASRKRAAQLQAQRSDLQHRDDEMARQQQIVKLVIDDRPAPVPGWFLGYLSDACPSDLVVTNLHIKHEEGLWRVQLSGTLQSTVPQPRNVAFTNSLALFTARLANGPFHVTIANEKEAATRPKGTPGAPRADWVSRVMTVASSKSTNENQFVIEGVMR